MRCMLKRVNVQLIKQENHLYLNFCQFSLTAAKEDPIQAIDIHTRVFKNSLQVFISLAKFQKERQTLRDCFQIKEGT